MSAGRRGESSDCLTFYRAKYSIFIDFLTEKQYNKDKERRC